MYSEASDPCCLLKSLEERARYTKHCAGWCLKCRSFLRHGCHLAPHEQFTTCLSYRKTTVYNDIRARSQFRATFQLVNTNTSIINRPLSSPSARSSKEKDVALAKSHAQRQQRLERQEKHCQLPSLWCAKARTPYMSRLLFGSKQELESTTGRYR